MCVWVTISTQHTLSWSGENISKSKNVIVVAVFVVVVVVQRCEERGGHLSCTPLSILDVVVSMAVARYDG